MLCIVVMEDNDWGGGIGATEAVTIMLKVECELKHCVDKLSKSTYPSLAPITVFVISGLQSVIY